MATVIFKPTEACNSRCVYCDVIKKKTSGAKMMDFATLAIFFNRVNEFLLERPREKMEIIWHGGEPLLLGPGYFERALLYQEKYCSETFSRIRHSIQSNLTLLSREFFEPLRKLGITRISSSYDPIPHIRGIGAKRDSKAYNKKFLDSIQLLNEEGFDWGVIYVVTKQSLEKPLEIFRFLTNLAPRGGLMFNPVLLYGPGLDHIRITPHEYVNFLGAIFPTWWRGRNDFGYIEPFSSTARNLIEETKSLMCVDSGGCAYSHIDVLPDGRASHCGRSADWGLLDYGCIQENSFSRIFSDPQREILARRNEVLPETECKGCRFWNVCHGGCPLDGWLAGGSFLHKSGWCRARKALIEKYVEPAVNGERAFEGNGLPHQQHRRPGALAPPVTLRSEPYGGTDPIQGDGAPIWIDPIGGLGDALMVSSVLKQVFDKYPSRKYCLVERTKYREILEGHPAIERIGYPPPDAVFVSTAYWRHVDFGLPGARPFQVLGRLFGLQPPLEEKLFAPWTIEQDPFLDERIPWKRSNILICPASESPRKQMSIDRWENLVTMLREMNIGVIQAGRLEDPYVRGAYSLLGMTTPRLLTGLLGRFDAVITVDNFVMHAAKLCGVPAVVLWGPTDHRVYGYSGHVHLRAEKTCDEYPGGCIGAGAASLYTTVCPKGSAHCLDLIDPVSIRRAVMSILQAGSKVVGEVKDT